MNADDYLQKRIDDQIKWLSSASGKNQQWFKKLRAAEIVMGCAITYLVSHAANLQKVRKCRRSKRCV